MLITAANISPAAGKTCTAGTHVSGMHKWCHTDFQGSTVHTSFLLTMMLKHVKVQLVLNARAAALSDTQLPACG